MKKKTGSKYAQESCFCFAFCSSFSFLPFPFPLPPPPFPSEGQGQGWERGGERVRGGAKKKVLLARSRASERARLPLAASTTLSLSRGRLCRPLDFLALFFVVANLLQQSIICDNNCSNGRFSISLYCIMRQRVVMVV